MAFLGETNSQTIVNSTLGFIFPNGSIIHNDNGVYFQTSTPVPIRVPNACDFAMLKTIIHNTLQLTDKYTHQSYLKLLLKNQNINNIPWITHQKVGTTLIPQIFLCH